MSHSVKMISPVIMSQTGIMSNRNRVSLISTSRTNASPKGTRPGVRRSRCPLSACQTRRKCSIKTSQINSVKGRIPCSQFGTSCPIWCLSLTDYKICPDSWKENLILFDKIPVSTIKLPQWPFQTFLDVSLFGRLLESRVALRINHLHVEQVWSYRINCGIKTP